MKKSIILMVSMVGIILAALFVYASVQEGFDQDPNFAPKEEWSIKYIQLFKQAIKEEYGIDDETLNNNLIIISVVKGTKSDGFAIPFTSEKFGKIHYIYKIDWALYNGQGIKFGVQDDSENNPTYQQILDNIKANLIPIFTIKNIIPKKKAIDACSPQAEFPDLKFPWYSEDNNIRYDDLKKELVFDCFKTISAKENKCLTETYEIRGSDPL